MAVSVALQPASSGKRKSRAFCTNCGPPVAATQSPHPPTLSRVLFQLGGRELVSRFEFFAALADNAAFRTSGGSGQCLHMRVVHGLAGASADRYNGLRAIALARPTSTAARNEGRVETAHNKGAWARECMRVCMCVYVRVQTLTYTSMRWRPRSSASSSLACVQTVSVFA